MTLFEEADFGVKGRGLRALLPISSGVELLTVVPDICVLYSPYLTTRCAKCFVEAAEACALAVCPSCHSHALCPTCATPHAWEAHAVVCQWYMSLDEQTRSGDTDYLRFVLEYAARVQQGDTRLMMALSQCCTNEASQDAQVLRFCSSFSELVVRHFGPRGMAIDREHINQLLMRTKVNSLGFPYDLERAYGWAMDSTICAVNHSCVPNCVVQCSKGGKMTLATIRDVAEGEELTIAYVTPQDIPNVKDRSRELLEHYRFLCRCTLCEQQRSSGSSSATNTNTCKADGE